MTTATVTTDADGRASWTVPVPPAPGDYRVAPVPSLAAGRSPTTATSGCRAPRQLTEDDDGYDKYLELIAEKKTSSPARRRGSSFAAPSSTRRSW